MEASKMKPKKNGCEHTWAWASLSIIQDYFSNSIEFYK